MVKYITPAGEKEISKDEFKKLFLKRKELIKKGKIKNEQNSYKKIKK